MSKRSIEPLLWLLFSAGGVLAALVIPIVLFLFGLAFPLGWITPPDHEHLLAVLRHPLTRVGVFSLVMLSLFHWAHRYNLDSRDGAQQERADIIFSSEGIWECTFVGECSVVCPKHVDPAGAIQQYKLKAATEWLKGVLMPWGTR